jgi:hypothetical protein
MRHGNGEYEKWDQNWWNIRRGQAHSIKTDLTENGV